VIHSFERGYPCFYDETTSIWRYEDNHQPCEEWGGTARPCVGCGEMPTPEGYDACLGYIAGMSSVCCGHGVHAAYSVAEGDFLVEPTEL